MNVRDERRRTLAELAADTGVPARTVRYYIAQGLLPGPGTAGRAADYGPEHLERLARIRELQAGGLTLAEIARELSGGAAAAAPAPAAWSHYEVDDGVVVMVRGDLPPWRLRRARRAVAELAARLKTAEGDSHDD